MSQIFIDNKPCIKAGNIAQATQLLKSLYSSRVGFVADNDTVVFVQNISMEDADRVLNPNKPVPQVVTPVKVKANKKKPAKKLSKCKKTVKRLKKVLKSLGKKVVKKAKAKKVAKKKKR